MKLFISAERLRKLKLLVTNTKPSGKFVPKSSHPGLCVEHKAQVGKGVDKTLECKPTKKGKFVVLHSSITNIMTVCEVRVYPKGRFSHRYITFSPPSAKNHFITGNLFLYRSLGKAPIGRIYIGMKNIVPKLKIYFSISFLGLKMLLKKFFEKIL
jgi:hypothetical protein